MAAEIRQVLSWCFAALLFSGGISGAQTPENKRPPLDVRDRVDTPAGFVPQGWRLEAERVREADLNSDGRMDAAFVISNGGSGSGNEDEPATVKHVLVLALRGSDGKLHRSIVSDAAVLDGDEGGAFGDPFDDLSVDHGTVLISHYGGSRQRWGFTHRYRFQNDQWMLVELSTGYTDTLDLEHFDNQDINLSTGLVQASEKGGYDDQPKKPEISGSYYELEVFPVDKVPGIDGRISAGEWPGYTLRLDEKDQVYRNRHRWHGANDLSASLHAVQRGDDLFLGVAVTDSEVTPGDTVMLRSKRGLIIKPRARRMTANGAGYVFEARYSLKDVAIAGTADDKYAVENLEMALDPSSVYGELQGFQLYASVQVWDVDRSTKPKARSVMSTKLAGSPYSGSIRIFRKGTLVLLSDNKRQHDE